MRVGVILMDREGFKRGRREKGRGWGKRREREKKKERRDEEGE